MPGVIFHSKDGINWSEDDKTKVATRSWVWSATNPDGTTVLFPQKLSQTDGIVSHDNYNWKTFILPDVEDDSWSDIIWDGEKFIAISDNFFLVYSYDGEHWDNIHATYGINPYIKYYTLLKE
jgi:hypothetical protein